MSQSYKLTNLPNELLENILSYLSYDEVAKYRVVCRNFNSTCGQLLNRGFLNMERRHSTILKKVKSLLPRRESERRVHHLARHSDILTAIETRISMLRMTFMKYVEMNACCFIPGKVIDEIFRILVLVEGTCTPPRTHEVLQELRDLSSMAMEHFDENIAPNLKFQRNVPYPEVLPGPSLFNSAFPGLLIKDTFRKDLSIVQRRGLVHKQQIFLLKEVVTKLVVKVKKQTNVIQNQTMKLREQSTKLKEQDTCIAELKRHVEEWDLKFADLVAELTRARDESTTPNASTAPKPCSQLELVTTSTYNSPPRLYKSNIKPRMAQILPRSLSRLEIPSHEFERKRKLQTSSSMSSIPTKISRLQFLANKDSEGDECEVKNAPVRHGNTLAKLPSFLSSSLESLLKSPISSIKSRKRKMQ